MDTSRDQGRGKGAMEQDPQNEGKGGNTSMQGQAWHRDEDAELKNADLIRPGERSRGAETTVSRMTSKAAKPRQEWLLERTFR